MLKRWMWSILLAMMVLFLATGQTLACTGILLHAADGAVVRGRTMEFGTPLDSDVLLIPRGLAMSGIATDGNANGLQWTTKYAAVGLNGLQLPVLVDGLNEKGLGGGLFYFPGFADYQAVAADEESKTIAPWQLLTWALTNFATTDEVKAALQDIKVGNVEFGAWKMVPPVHLSLTDAADKSIVVEYVAGELAIYDNPTGVLTNSPPYDWHLINLRNYITISPDPTKAVNLGSLDLDPLSTGGNLFGLPGDFSSPSRFVRATVFSVASPQQKSGQDAVMQGFHILDQFDIPEGAVPEPAGSDPPFEITEWTTMSDLQTLTFYIWTFDNRAIQTINLNDLELESKEIVTYTLEATQEFVNLAP